MVVFGGLGMGYRRRCLLAMSMSTLLSHGLLISQNYPWFEAIELFKTVIKKKTSLAKLQHLQSSVCIATCEFAQLVQVYGLYIYIISSKDCEHLSAYLGRYSLMVQQKVRLEGEPKAQGDCWLYLAREPSNEKRGH